MEHILECRNSSTKEYFFVVAQFLGNTLHCGPFDCTSRSIVYVNNSLLMSVSTLQSLIYARTVVHVIGSCIFTG